MTNERIDPIHQAFGGLAGGAIGLAGAALFGPLGLAIGVVLGLCVGYAIPTVARSLAVAKSRR